MEAPTATIVTLSSQRRGQVAGGQALVEAAEDPCGTRCRCLRMRWRTTPRNATPATSRHYPRVRFPPRPHTGRSPAYLPSVCARCQQDDPDEAGDSTRPWHELARPVSSTCTSIAALIVRYAAGIETTGRPPRLKPAIASAGPLGSAGSWRDVHCSAGRQVQRRMDDDTHQI
jgi:hypothetical protein